MNYRHQAHATRTAPTGGLVRYRVRGDDGAEVIVDGFDWMTAMVHAIEQLGLEVSGWVCETRPDGSTWVLDAMSGRSWTVEAIGEGEVSPSGPQGKTVLPEAARAGDLVADTASAPPAPPASAARPAPREHPRTEPPRPVAGLRPAGPPRGHSGPPPERPKRRTLSERPRRRPPGARSFPTAELSVEPSARSAPPDSAPPVDLAERLFDRSMDLAGAPTRDDACRLALALVLDLVACEAGSVLRGGLNDEYLTFVAVAGPAAAELQGQKLPFGDGIVGASFDLGIAIEVSDVGEDPRHASAFDERTGFRTRSVLCVPVQGRDVYHGALQLLNPLSGRFLPWHREVAEQVANSLASTLDGVAH